MVRAVKVYLILAPLDTYRSSAQYYSSLSYDEDARLSKQDRRWLWNQLLITNKCVKNSELYITHVTIL